MCKFAISTYRWKSLNFFVVFCISFLSLYIFFYCRYLFGDDFYIIERSHLIRREFKNSFPWPTQREIVFSIFSFFTFLPAESNEEISQEPFLIVFHFVDVKSLSGWTTEKKHTQIPNNSVTVWKWHVPQALYRRTPSILLIFLKRKINPFTHTMFRMWQFIFELNPKGIASPYHGNSSRARYEREIERKKNNLITVS